MLVVQQSWYLFLGLLILGCNIGDSNNSLQNEIRPTDLPDYRLPTSLYPTRYHLRLFVVLDPLLGYERFTATGDIAINATCVENTNQIYLHAVNLTISQDSVRVADRDGTELTVTTLTYEILNDFLMISLSSPLQNGETYVISMHYVAPIPDYRLNGMYQDYYQDPETSETRYVATTLFAPYHARRLFPSFDEPSFRAEYDVGIGHHKKYHAMANEEVIFRYQVPDQPDYVVDIFKTTPNISSYIAAMIVSDFTFEEATENRFSDRTVRGAGEYAANITDAVMAFLEDRFQVKYPLNKLYSIALPHFFFSAMENIGMITYKEPVLLYLKNETTEEQRYQINSVMSHELSHQWFGNIVACRFWSWVWLKEGFSTFYSHYGMNHTNPELNPWEMFIPKVLNVAMSFDASNATHPLENPPPTSAAVADIYTTIPYNKGASINRMTSTFLTENVFEQAMKIYINKFQYSSAEQNDLFESLQEAVDQNPLISSFIPTSVQEIMDSWTLQSGFPIINVSRVDSSHIKLAQEKFEQGPSNFSITWWVPITLQPRSRPDLPGTVPDTWIPKGEKSVTVEITFSETIIVNPDATGYYRVQYDDALRLDIVALLQNDHIKVPATGRSKLIDDYFELALSGYLPIESAMDFTKYIHKDMNTAVWHTLHNTMNDLIKLLTQIEENETVELLKEYLLGKISRALTNFQLIIDDNDGGSLIGYRSMLYELLVRWSCDLGSCVAFLEEDISSFIASPDNMQIPKEKQLPIYCTANAQSSSSANIFEYILGEYSNPKTLFGRKERLLKALTCTKNPSRLKWLIQEIFDKESPYFSVSESGQLLQHLAKRPVAVEHILDTILNKSALFFNRYDDSITDKILLAMAENSREPKYSQVMNLVEQLQYSNPERATRVHALATRSQRRRALLSNSLAGQLRTWLIS